MRKALTILMLAAISPAWAHHPNEEGGWVAAVLDHLSEPDHLAVIAILAIIGGAWFAWRAKRAAKAVSS
jgi:hydrogenase/urease accessory protein HupE